jgi:hypothetical protein
VGPRNGLRVHRVVLGGLSASLHWRLNHSALDELSRWLLGTPGTNKNKFFAISHRSFPASWDLAEHANFLDLFQLRDAKPQRALLS